MIAAAAAQMSATTAKCTASNRYTKSYDGNKYGCARYSFSYSSRKWQLAQLQLRLHRLQCQPRRPESCRQDANPAYITSMTATIRLTIAATIAAQQQRLIYRQLQQQLQQLHMSPVAGRSRTSLARAPADLGSGETAKIAVQAWLTGKFVVASWQCQQQYDSERSAGQRWLGLRAPQAWLTGNLVVLHRRLCLLSNTTLSSRLGSAG